VRAIAIEFRKESRLASRFDEMMTRNGFGIVPSKRSGSRAAPLSRLYSGKRSGAPQGRREGPSAHARQMRASCARGSEATSNMGDVGPEKLILMGLIE
jgi:hypothetical protein